MCRSDVAHAAREALAALLAEMARKLAARSGVDEHSVIIGPVDFGEPLPVVG